MNPILFFLTMAGNFEISYSQPIAVKDAPHRLLDTLELGTWDEIPAQDYGELSLEGRTLEVKSAEFGTDAEIFADPMGSQRFSPEIPWRQS